MDSKRERRRDRDRQTQILTQIHSPGHQTESRVPGETDPEPKPPREPTPRKDRTLSDTAESPTGSPVPGTEKVSSRCLGREGNDGGMTV